jgi:hypothetical protein
MTLASDLCGDAEDRRYRGNELELFADARNWKRYLAHALQPYLRGDVIEVGAGLGATTSALCGRSVRSWLCLEPDPEMAARLDADISQGRLPASCSVRCGVTRELPVDRVADLALYVDVLEHIEDDKDELGRISGHIREGGFIAVLSPAHRWLYSEFDDAIGHWRRYGRRDARALTPPGFTLRRAVYLDSVGILASMANRILLRSSTPTASQIRVWDTFMVPISRRLDPLLWFGLGKSVLFVWERSGGVVSPP